MEIDEKDELVKLVQTSNSLSEVLIKQGKSVSGTSVKILKEKLSEYEINFSFLDEKRIVKKELNEILVENSTYKNSFHLLERLYKEGYKEYRCEKCGITRWDDKPIRLQLHHINGVHTDNRIENLQVLCPNCHTQTDNWGNKGENNVKRCADCGCVINKRSRYCRKCVLKHVTKNENKPKKEKLELDLLNGSFEEIGDNYCVSQKIVRNWCKKYGLPYTKTKLREYLKKKKYLENIQ